MYDFIFFIINVLNVTNNASKTYKNRILKKSPDIEVKYFYFEDEFKSWN